MPANPATPPNLGEQICDTIESALGVAEAEIRHAVAYVDAVVVPEVRRESGAALTKLATHIERLGAALNEKGKQPR
jgi:hypothetical protein